MNQSEKKKEKSFVFKLFKEILHRHARFNIIDKFFFLTSKQEIYLPVSVETLVLVLLFWNIRPTDFPRRGWKHYKQKEHYYQIEYIWLTLIAGQPI